MLGSSSHFFSTTELPRILHCGAARVYTEHLGHQNCSGKEGAGTTFRKNSRDRPAQSVSHTHLDLPTIACLGKSESFRDSRPQVTVPPRPPMASETQFTGCSRWDDNDDDDGNDDLIYGMLFGFISAAFSPACSQHCRGKFFGLTFF